MNDITKPKHYTQGKVECLDAIDSMLEESSRKTSTVPRLSNICGGSAIKAVHWRMPRKLSSILIG